MKKLILILMLTLMASCQQYRQFPEVCKHDKKLVFYNGGAVYEQCTKCKRHIKRIR